jgi:hypothetical protein
MATAQSKKLRISKKSIIQTKNFILNSASFHAPNYHREMAELVSPTIQPNEMVQAINDDTSICLSL